MAQAYAQESSQLKFNTELAPDKGQQGQEWLDLDCLWEHNNFMLMMCLTPPPAFSAYHSTVCHLG